MLRHIDDANLFHALCQTTSNAKVMPMKMTLKNTLLLATSFLCGCFFMQPTSAFAANDNFDLEADKVFYEESGNIVRATGKVKVSSKNHGTVEADTLRYDRKKDRIVAEGNIIFTTPEGFVTRTHKIELFDDMKSGTSEALNIRIQKYDNAHINATGARFEGEKIHFSDAVYSSCPIRQTFAEDGSVEKAKAPVWRIRSDNVTVDTEEETITYNDMWFDVHGQPVFWLPWMRHPANPDKAYTGLMPPDVATSGNRGQEVRTSFYWRQDDQKDAELETRYMSKKGLLLSGRQRFIMGNTTGEFNGGVIDDDELENTRSFIDGSAEHVFNKGQRAGFAVQRSSDDTFYDDFLVQNPNFLTSSLYGEDTSDKHYLGVSSTHFVDQRIGRSPENTPQPLLNIAFNKVFDVQERRGEEFFVDTSLTTLERDEGVDMRRGIVGGGWRKHINTKDGSLFDLEASLQTAFYQIDNNAANEDNEQRVLPQLSAMWQKPFISPNGKHVITPMAKVVASPADSNPNDIPNEESTFIEVDATNIFQNNRYAGQDRVENGARFIYGLENSWSRNYNRQLSLFVGQSYRTGDDNTFANNSGLSTKFSDWVSQARIQTNGASLSTRFRLDNNSLTPRRVDTFFDIGSRKKHYLGLLYTYLDGGNEEIQANARVELNNAWAVSGAWQHDLNGDGKLLTAEGRLTYTHCCYKVSFLVRRRGFENRNVESSTDFLLNFDLLTLGRQDEE